MTADLLSLAARPSDRELCNWLVETCLTFGASLPTAHKVASVFIEGIIASREKKSNG